MGSAPGRGRANLRSGFSRCLTWAEATHDCPYGRITPSWRIAQGIFEIEVTIPPGTTANIVLPDGTSALRTSGTWRYQCEDIDA
ncbi:alpha-L-rhamnosidase C-terminal domain-containing protein [Mycobacterium sp.]|uniref:alpha-L-rhamnosidase C-terminal domain-containing protein n=1 Tax=Mycobacterium sp. TaxID=1785 RepID=UPI0039C91819